jgi:hypothetical protein
MLQNPRETLLYPRVKIGLAHSEVVGNIEQHIAQLIGGVLPFLSIPPW